MNNNKNYTILKPELLSVYNVWYDNNSNARDLTGWTGVMHIYDSKEVLLESVVLTCNASGEIEGTADSTNWNTGTYSYYMRLAAPGGRIVDLIEGKVCVK